MGGIMYIWECSILSQDDAVDPMLFSMQLASFLCFAEGALGAIGFFCDRR